MERKKYYSERYNLREQVKFSERDLSDLFVQTYFELSTQGLLKELLGYTNQWGNNIRGLVANDYDTFVYKRIGKRGLVPIDSDEYYREDDVFDLIELLYDYVSVPKDDGTYERSEGKKIFREEMNYLLNNYDDGYELTEIGYIRLIMNNGMEELVDTNYEIEDESTRILNDSKKKILSS